MADSIVIHLASTTQTWSLSRSFIRQTLPGSLLASALEDDIEAKTITLTNPAVTPAVLQLLVDFSQGQEPLHHNPNLTLAHRYLNIPWLLDYANPAYDTIRTFKDVNAREHTDFIETLIQTDDIRMYTYLLRKGLYPTQKQFIVAVKSNARQIVGRLLASSTAEINPARNFNAAFRLSVKEGFTELVQLLLQDPRVDPVGLNLKGERFNSLVAAVERGHVAIVKLLMVDPRIDQEKECASAMEDAAMGGHADIVKLFLAEAKLNNIDVNDALREAVQGNHEAVVRLLLVDNRVDAWHINEALEDAVLYGHRKMCRLLLADPRVTQAGQDKAYKAALRKKKTRIIRIFDLLFSVKSNCSMPN